MGEQKIKKISIKFLIIEIKIKNMRYKVYNYRTKKAHWIDEEECGNAEGLSFLEFLKKYGNKVEKRSEDGRKEIEKAFSELEESEENDNLLLN